MSPRAPMRTQEFRMVRRFSRVVRIACVGMGIFLVLLSGALLILGWDFAEMVWLAVFNAALGAPLIYLGFRGTPWSHNYPWSRTRPPPPPS